MSKSRIKVLGMLSLPLAAFAVAAVLLSVNLGTGSHHASANQPNSALEYTLHTGGAGCDSTGDLKGNCHISVGSVFTVSVSLDAIPGPYDAIGVTLNYSGVLKGKFETASKQGPKITGNWPDCVFEAAAPLAAGFQNDACAIGAGAPSSTYVGTVLTTQLTCASAGTGEVHLVHGGADTLIIAGGKTSTDNGPDAVNVECVPATNTFTPTPTATPPPIPKMQKDCDAATAGIQTECNVFLHRQGTKIPPATCLSGTDGVTLNEGINIPISTINPKGDVQDLAAFEFEVRYDAKNVCVVLNPATQWTDAGAVCTIRDDTNSTLKGIAQIGCVTVGKGVNTDGPALATITVHPSPELYSQMRPNQDNGIPVQILNQGCNLADEQGHAIPVFSCEDADLTFRYLEGDIDGPDCDVDVFDTQQVAFRWGVHKGSLLYNSFMDLEPSGQVKGNGAIDIKDVQFVFGRFGSTCTAPWPAQAPVNPKA